MPTETSKSPLKFLPSTAGMLLSAGASMVKGHRERKAKFEAENPNEKYAFDLKASLGDALIGAAPVFNQNQMMDKMHSNQMELAKVRQPSFAPFENPDPADMADSFAERYPTMTGSGIGSLMGGFNPNLAVNYLYGPSRSSAFRKTGSPLAYNMSATQAALEDKFSNVNRGITSNNPESDTSKMDKYANVYNKLVSQIGSSGNYSKYITSMTNFPLTTLKLPEDKPISSNTGWMDMFDRGTNTGTSSNAVDRGTNTGTLQLMPDTTGNKPVDPNMMIQYFRTKKP